MAPAKNADKSKPTSRQSSRQTADHQERATAALDKQEEARRLLAEADAELLAVQQEVQAAVQEANGGGLTFYAPGTSPASVRGLTPQQINAMSDPAARSRGRALLAQAHAEGEDENADKLTMYGVTASADDERAVEMADKHIGGTGPVG